MISSLMRRAKYPRTLSVKRLSCFEILEQRRLLHSGVPTDLPRLQVDPDSYDESSILVRFRADQLADGIEDTANGRANPGRGNGKRPDFSLLPSLRRVSLAAGLSVADALASYRENPAVLYAEPNYKVHLVANPGDPDFTDLWGLNNTGQTLGTPDADIDAPEAWDVTTGSASTVVAVVDTGVDYTHEDLAQNMWVNLGETPGDGVDNDGNGFVDDIHGYDFVNNDGDPMDDHWHGTHVAGTIGAVGDNGVGVTGVNWNVSIMAVKFLDASGSGSTFDAIAALDYAVANGATISNHSWGDGGSYSQALIDAIQNARDADHIFVAAAGNGGFD